MSMLHWVKKDDNPNLVLFVHGLKGGLNTWSYDEKTSFPSMLSEDPKINDSHDIACFNYFTTFTNTYGKTKSWISRIFGSTKKSRKNLPIDEIAELLRTEFQVNLSEYDNVVLVAHSMGGLVSKACILKQLEENQNTTVKGFISLAVPHSGAKVANIGGLISKNIQLSDLSVLSDAIDRLTRNWIHAQNKPRAKYIYAANDQYVDKKSALAIDTIKKDSMAVDEDHSSICKPQNTNETVYQAVLKYILEFKSSYSGVVTIENYIDDKMYDDEYFVLKLVIADVHETITGHAKEYFFNAELVRKIFTSDSDRNKLDTLYKKIKFIYQEEYEKHLVEKTSSDSLVTSVHSRIMKEDKEYLQSILSDIDNVHKKGMLHQIANKCDKTVVWDHHTCLSTLDKMKEGSE